MSDDLLNCAQSVAVLFLTEPSLQAQAFISLLQKEIVAPIQIHNIRTPLPAMLPAGTLVLFDIVSANKRLNQFWQNTLRKQQHPINVLLINMDDWERGKTLSDWPALSDIFYHSDTQHDVHTRIKELINISYNTVQDLTLRLFHYQKRKNVAETAKDALTDREKQILARLCQGATNHDIACALFISEHTVRTHVYNLFKKIKVKSRIQAVSWATGNFRKIEAPLA
ncbi:MAG: LuxR C-terminal-related transcriptional regulator [Silvania sp.]|uniref:LuxR C-terminal-related transcriptional regulator n=1 Tax=Silvania sp. TaxID=3016633 RepID=UPI003EE612D7